MIVDKHIAVDGHFVSQRVSQVITAIREYSPELDVLWIPPGARGPDTAAFKIIHNPPGKEPYTICHVKTEEEFDQRLLHRIIAGDQRNGELKYSDFEAAEKARQLVEKQKFLDKMEELNDIAHHVFKSHKSKYKVNDGLVIDDSIPFNVAPLHNRRK